MSSEAIGLETYRHVYGEHAIVLKAGASESYDLMIQHLFGAIWSRPGLSILFRRLLVLGALAAQREYEMVEFHLRCALANGELSADQVREIVLQLEAYVGYSASGGLNRAAAEAVRRSGVEEQQA